MSEDIELIKEHVRSWAHKVRNGLPFSDPGVTAVEWISQAWKYDDSRADAQVLVNKFPGLFPLLGVRACE